MNDYLRRNYESCAGASQFLTDNQADFNTGMPKAKRQDLAAAVADVETKRPRWLAAAERPRWRSSKRGRPAKSFAPTSPR